jgi:1-phosphofructokinase family hexose kinase
MILTVTLNSALDRILFIDEFRSGATMRPHKVVEAVGGKGFDVSVVLQTLGAENIGLGVVAGLTGQQLVRLLDRYGITYDLIWVEGETRIAHVVVETKYHRHSLLTTAGLLVSPEAYQAFVERYRVQLGQTAWVIAGGTLAAGVPVSAYRQLIEMAHQAGVPILVDSSGPPIQETLVVPPTILKMNDDEFAQTFETQAKTLEELASQAKTIYERERLCALVITCGSEGILAFTSEGAYLATVPSQQAVNAAGAGDGVSAALGWRLSQGDSWPEALRWAAATGAAVVLTEGTADCHIIDIERLYPQTSVRLV